MNNNNTIKPTLTIEDFKRSNLLPMWVPYIRHINDGESGLDFVRTTNMTPSHAYKLLKLMKKDRLIIMTKQGRVYKIIFTPKGNKVRKHIDRLYKMLGID